MGRLQVRVLEGWGIHPASMDYFPEGAGSHHWRVIDEGGRPHFVTVDDLDTKEWLGSTRSEVCAGLNAAFGTADLLRRKGLRFVVAPVAARDGAFVHRVDDHHALSVSPFCEGTSYPFATYSDSLLRDATVDLVAELHRSTDPVIRDRAPRHVIGYGAEGALEAFLDEPERPWDGGPFSEPTRLCLAAHQSEIAELVTRYEWLVHQTAVAREKTVITHGEPHVANLISADDRVLLVDWDTTALAPRERDLCLIAAEPGPAIERYQERTGHTVDFAVIYLYRLRWYLDDLATTVRLFRHSHVQNTDTQHRWDGLAPLTAQIPQWLDRR